ncbi:MAG: thiamine diphosphokinase [Eubacteriales bacterium]
MNCLIILNGNIINNDAAKEAVKNADLVICADGGAKWASETKIKVDAVIGDFDSASTEIIDLYRNTDTKIITAPDEKDETDGVLAVDYAILRGAESVTILGAAGGRLDHQFGNLMLLKRLQDSKCRGRIILDEGYAVMSNKCTKIDCRIGDIISIVPFDGELVINESAGLKYPIDKGTNFKNGYPIGLSNIAVDGEVILDITGGTALIFCYKK